MSTMTAALDELLWAVRHTFAQHRTFLRARHMAYGFILAWGRHTISRALCALHAQFDDWSASYRLFSRAPWEPTDLFRPVLQQCAAMANQDGLLAIALDDTMLAKSSKRIPGVSYGRDPMSPKFHPNLILGQRHIQASFILRPEGLAGPARTIPVRFRPAPPPAKPKKKASEEAWAAYRYAQKTQNLSCHAVAVMKDIREDLDRAGYIARTLLFVTDGGYCNGTVLRYLPERIEVVARTRGDITLFRPPTAEQLVGRGRRRKYGDALPKPKEILADDAFPWLETAIHGAGKLHDLRYKVVDNVLWRSGTRVRPLRLIVIAPLRYRRTQKSRLLYREPAYLLSTDLTTSAATLIQAYFDRWEIEVNHRDEKSLFGVGDAQVWSGNAARRVPQFQVAIYAMLLLASLTAYGPKRTGDYLPRPKWHRQGAHRPSISDILELFRDEMAAEAVASLHRVRHQQGGRQASRRTSVPLIG